MILLVLGVLVWSGVHLVPSLGVQMRAGGILAATAADSKAGARWLLIDSEWR